MGWLEPIFELGLSYRENSKNDPKNDPFPNCQYATHLQKYGTGTIVLVRTSYDRVYIIVLHMHRIARSVLGLLSHEESLSFVVGVQFTTLINY